MNTIADDDVRSLNLGNTRETTLLQFVPAQLLSEERRESEVCQFGVQLPAIDYRWARVPHRA